MTKLFATLALALTISAAAFSQSTTVHTSGGDATSWALARVGPGQTAMIGDMNGIKIGELKHDEFIVVRSGKGYYSTDEKLMREVEAARAPLDALRLERDGVREKARAIRDRQRQLVRDARSVERQAQGLERKLDRTDDSQKESLRKEITDLNQKVTALNSKATGVSAELTAANANVDAVNKRRDAAREAIEKKVEGIIDSAFRNNLLHPL